MADNTDVDIDSIHWADRASFVDKKVVSGCPLIDAFLMDPLPALCREVLVIRRSEMRRWYVEAALLTEASDVIVGDTLDIHPEIVGVYRKVFFDVGSMDRISKIEVVESCKDESEKNLKLWAMTQGMDFLAWRLGKPVKLSPVDGLSALFSDSYFKARESFFNGSSSASAANALKWTKQTVEIGKLLKAWVSDSEAAVKDIEFALREFTEDEKQFDLLDSLNLDEEPIEDADFEDIPGNKIDG